MNLNGTIKKTQALSGRLVKSSGGGGSVQEIYWVQFGVGTATNAEVNEAVAANKLPICYWDSTDAYGRPRRTLYFLIRNTPTESFFSGVDYINNTIIVRRLYADAWDTQTIRYEGKLTWDTTPRFGSANPVTSGGIYNAIQNATVSDERIAEAVDDWLSVQAPSIGTLSYAAKQALLACFRHVAWIDDQGQSYYNALESELFPDATLESISAVFTQGSATIYDTDSLDTLKQYLVVTATYSDSTTATVTDYTLSGTLTAGTSTITVSYGGKTDTFSVTVVTGTLYELSSTFTSTGTNSIDTGISFADGESYTILAEFTPTSFDSTVRGVYSDRAENVDYCAMQVQKSSNTNYMWGSGLGWSAGAGLGITNARYRFALTIAFDSSDTSVRRNGVLANRTNGTQTSFNGDKETYTFSGVNITLGKRGTYAGFIGTVSDFKIVHGVMSNDGITAYLAG